MNVDDLENEPHHHQSLGRVKREKIQDRLGVISKHLEVMREDIVEAQSEHARLWGQTIISADKDVIWGDDFYFSQAYVRWKCVVIGIEKLSETLRDFVKGQIADWVRSIVSVSEDIIALTHDDVEAPDSVLPPPPDSSPSSSLGITPLQHEEFLNGVRSWMLKIWSDFSKTTATKITRSFLHTYSALLSSGSVTPRAARGQTSSSFHHTVNMSQKRSGVVGVYIYYKKKVREMESRKASRDKVARNLSKMRDAQRELEPLTDMLCAQFSHYETVRNKVIEEDIQETYSIFQTLFSRTALGLMMPTTTPRRRTGSGSPSSIRHQQPPLTTSPLSSSPDSPGTMRRKMVSFDGSDPSPENEMRKPPVIGKRSSLDGLFGGGKKTVFDKMKEDQNKKKEEEVETALQATSKDEEKEVNDPFDVPPPPPRTASMDEFDFEKFDQDSSLIPEPKKERGYKLVKKKEVVVDDLSEKKKNQQQEGGEANENGSEEVKDGSWKTYSLSDQKNDSSSFLSNPSNQSPSSVLSPKSTTSNTSSSYLGTQKGSLRAIKSSEEDSQPSIHDLYHEYDVILPIPSGLQLMKRQRSQSITSDDDGDGEDEEDDFEEEWMNMKVEDGEEVAWGIHFSKRVELSHMVGKKMEWISVRRVREGSIGWLRGIEEGVIMIAINGKSVVGVSYIEVRKELKQLFSDPYPTPNTSNIAFTFRLPLPKQNHQARKVMRLRGVNLFEYSLPPPSLPSIYYPVENKNDESGVEEEKEGDLVSEMAMKWDGVEEVIHVMQRVVRDDEGEEIGDYYRRRGGVEEVNRRQPFSLNQCRERFRKIFSSVRSLSEVADTNLPIFAPQYAVKKSEMGGGDDSLSPSFKEGLYTSTIKLSKTAIPIKPKIEVEVSPIFLEIEEGPPPPPPIHMRDAEMSDRERKERRKKLMEEANLILKPLSDSELARFQNIEIPPPPDPPTTDRMRVLDIDEEDVRVMLEVWALLKARMRLDVAEGMDEEEGKRELIGRALSHDTIQRMLKRGESLSENNYGLEEEEEEEGDNVLDFVLSQISNVLSSGALLCQDETDNRIGWLRNADGQVALPASSLSRALESERMNISTTSTSSNHGGKFSFYYVDPESQSHLYGRKGDSPSSSILQLRGFRHKKDDKDVFGRRRKKLKKRGTIVNQQIDQKQQDSKEEETK